MPTALIRIIVPLVVIVCTPHLRSVVATEPAAPLHERLAEVEERFRTEWGGITAEELTPASVPNDDNRAMPVLRVAIRIAELRARTDESRHWWDLNNDYSLDRVRENLQEIETELLPYGEVLAAIDDLEARNRSIYKLDYSSLDRRLGVSAISLIDLNRLMVARALVRLERDDPGGAAGDALAILSISQSYAPEPDGIVQILRWSSTMDALGVLREIVAGTSVDPTTLAVAQKRLEELATHSPTIQFLRGELLFQLAQIDKAGRDARRDGWDTVALADMLAVARIKQIETTERWMDYLSVPPYRRGAPPVDAVSQTEDAETLHFEEELGDALDWSRLFGRQVWDQFVPRFDLDLTRTRLAITALAVERFAADRGGRFPDSVSDLVPNYLDAVPDDPFTGEPFEYERTEAGYRLGACEAAIAEWSVSNRDPILDWSRPEREAFAEN